MQSSHDAGGLTGIWAPVDAAAGDASQNQQDSHPAERDPMQTDEPAGGAQKARCRLHDDAGCSGAIKCAARVRPGGTAEVLDLAAAGSKVAAALQDGSVLVYNVGQSSFHQVSKVSAADSPVTAVAFSDSALVLAVAADGVREISTPGSGAFTTYKDPKGSELYCAAPSPDGKLLAAGGEGRLLIFDRQMQRLAAAFGETHKEAVSQVIWVPGLPATLISASDDGLVAVFDFSDEIDEDDSWRAALNLDGAVARMGFYGENNARLWMVSQLAGLHLWEWQAACAEDASGGEGTLADIQDARGPLADAAKEAAAAAAARRRGNASDSSGASPPVAFDYLLSCTYEAARDRLLLAAGDSSGTVAVFPVREPGGGKPAAFGPPVAWASGAHTEVVRGLAWLEQPAGAIVTGAEDGQLCLWVPAAGSAPRDAHSEPKHTKKRRK